MIFGLHDTDITYTTLHLLDITYTTLYLLLLLSTLSRDLDTQYIHYLVLIFLILFLHHVHWVTHYFAHALINEINQAGVIGGNCSRENTMRCAWKGGSSEGLATRVFDIYARTCYYILHDTWVQWIVSPCDQDPLTHHLFDIQLSYGMGHRMVALVRVIKYARHIHLHHILHCLQWSSTWLIFSWY